MMNALRTLVLLVAGCGGLLLATGCGGAPPQAGGAPEGAELCAVNPLASSCMNVESMHGAVFGVPNFTSDWYGLWGDYKCSPTDSVTWHIGGRTHTTQNAYSSFWQTRYEVVDLSIGQYWGFTATLSVAPRMDLANGMDGPYHVIYNTVPYTESVCMKTLWHSQCMLVTIPAYGTWIYAKNERADYPYGVQVITIDPQQPDPANGTCNGRIQFVLAI